MPSWFDVLLKGVRGRSSPSASEAANAFAYIQFKASRFLQVGPDEYRLGDALGQPPAEWGASTIEILTHGCQQILDGRGLRPDQPLEGLGTARFERLLQLFHFELSSRAVVDSTADAMLHRLEMRHVVDGRSIVFYNLVQHAPVGEARTLANLWRHPLAGVAFPAETSDFVRGDLTRFDDFGHEVGVAYASVGSADRVQVTLFVIPAGGRSAAEQLSDAAGQVAAVHHVVAAGPQDSLSAAGMTGLGTMVEITDFGGRAGHRVRSWIWVLESGGWLLKVRCTASMPHPVEAVTVALKRLLAEVGRPRTREIVNQRHMDALVVSRAAREALLAWQPEVAPALRAVVDRAAELAREGRTAEAAERLRSVADDATPGVHALIGRIHLQDGQVAGAVEACLAEKEAPGGQAEVLAAALRTHVPDGLDFTGGLGTSPHDAVRLEGVRSVSEHVCAVFRYLECALGQRETDWTLHSACIVAAGERLYDAVRCDVPPGDSVTLFFDVAREAPGVPDATLARFSLAESGTQAPESTADGSAPGQASRQVDSQAADGLVACVFERLMAYTSVNLANSSR